MRAQDPADRGGPAAGALRELALGAGEPFPGGANRVIALDDADVVWFVEEGSLDVFAIESREADVALGVSGLKHMFRAQRGEIAFGFAPGEPTLRLVAKGSADARLRRAPLAAFLGEESRAALARHVDRWVTALCAAVTRDITLRPQVDRRVEAAGEVKLPAGTVAASRRGVTWTMAPDSGGGATYLDTETLGGEGPRFAPLTPEAWLRLGDSGALPCITTGKLAAGGDLKRALDDFHRLIARAELLNRQVLVADMAEAQMASRRHRLASERSARHGLSGLLRQGSVWRRRQPPAESGDSQSELAAALAAVGEWDGIEFRSPPPDARDPDAMPTLDDILGVSGVRCRRVTLSVEDRWWRGDSGALLGYLRQGGVPVALLPGRLGGYRMVSSRGVRRINAARARLLLPDAWSFLRPLPRGRPATGGDLLRVAGTRLGPDLLRVALLGLAAGMVLLTPAVVIGLLTNEVIPAGAVGTLVQLAALLAALGALGALARILQGATVLKLEARLALRLDAAIQDRVFTLPTAFVRRFTAGDLTLRASSFRDLRNRISGMVLQSLLSAVFLLPTFGLLFLYDTAIGWMSLILGTAGVALGAVLGLRQIGPQRRWYAASRELASLLRQFLGSMGKLRTTGAQASAYAIWAQRYREQQRAYLDIGRFHHHLVALGVAAPAFAGAMLLWAAWALFGGTTGDFLTIYAASMVFYLVISRLGDSFAALAGAWPTVDQVRPLLEQQPDTHLTGTGGAAGAGAPDSFGLDLDTAPAAPARGDVQLRGALGIHQVSWGYEDGPLVLEDVSLHADPGEFIAIVGGSGAGKSTLLRLALGLARPASGRVSYDGRDLERMDAASIRRQVGVVLQDGDLPGGTVEEAILGAASTLDVNDAWRAARLSAVHDDIAAMPMGMHTPVGSNGASLSGGQVQRIQIAGALARDPRILFLDEATNWLDNRSQAALMENIQRMDITRIVVAHRLSTIRHADRIYVLEAGRVVQQGSYDRLAGVEGAFRDLASRQLA